MAGARQGLRSELEQPADGSREGGHVVEMQRRRLLSATAELVYERRTANMTVARICDRARVSRKTFYDLFERREECMLATFEDGVARAREAVVDAVDCEANGRGAHGWRERVRVGLVALLGFLDREPGIGRLLVVDALAAGEETLLARARVLERAIAIVDEGRDDAKASRELPPLTAEGIVGAVLSIVHARMISSSDTGASEQGSLGARPRMVELAGPLMAMIVQPYLGPTAVQRELERPAPAQSTATRLPADPFKDLSIRVTYRTARVLATIAADPGANNKRIGAIAGAPDQGQVSKLLGRLERHGLIENHGKGHAAGEPNAWQLTPRGHAIHTALGNGNG
jgi:AcrR family transcriptional regulator/DNA-binding MarR family transcriptional regulator